MTNFWQQLPKPIFALAPMADVTDAAFRRIVAKYSKVEGAWPFVTYTEFVSADGLTLAPEEGRAKLMRDLLYSEAERPIVAQFFTATPAHMEAAAALAQELGFDGVDINMGCPDRSIEKQGAGAQLMLNPQLAQELIVAAKRSAPNLPVSVKTRLGYSKDILGEWLPALLAAEPATIIIHARTRKEMSKIPAHWDRIKRAVEIRNELGSPALIIGNGDLKDVEDAQQKIAQSGADGAMLGRAIFGSPWLFGPAARANELQQVPKRLKVAVEHTKLFEELLGDVKNFSSMKKTLTSGYCQGFPGAKELRAELMGVADAADVERIVSGWLAGHNLI